MSESRRSFLRKTGAGLAVSAVVGTRAKASPYQKKPNIIWIVAEDICPDLGTYGNDTVKTPNLDEFAAQGAKYTNAFATNPVCSPSRSAFFTGMYQTSIGAHQHRSHTRDDYTLPGQVRMLSDYLRDAGYFTMLIGPKQKTDFNFNPTHDVFDARDSREGSAMGAYTHGEIGAKMLEGPAFQKYPGDRPFFAQINYSEAHRTFINDPEDPIDPEEVDLPPQYPDHPIARRVWALYLETVQILDKKIGTLMQELEDKGLTENTAVFFFGDHGRAMLRGKQWLYDGGIHVPMMIRWPGEIESGTVNSDLVSLIDISATTLEIAGVHPPDYMQGNVILGPNAKSRDYIFAARDRCDETDDRIRAVRTKRYKYIRNFHPLQPYTKFNAYKKLQYPMLTLMQVLHREGKLTTEQEQFLADTRPPEELYDLRKDSHEVKNLADNPEYESILTELRHKLDEWIYETGDMGQVPEDPEVALYWDRFFEEHWKENMEERGLSPDISDEEYLQWWDEKLTELEKG